MLDIQRKARTKQSTSAYFICSSIYLLSETLSFFFLGGGGEGGHSLTFSLEC